MSVAVDNVGILKAVVVVGRAWRGGIGHEGLIGGRGVSKGGGLKVTSKVNRNGNKERKRKEKARREKRKLSMISKLKMRKNVYI